MPACTVDADASSDFRALVEQLAERFSGVHADLANLYSHISQNYLIGDRIGRLKKGAEYAGSVYKYGCPNSDRGSGRSWGYRIIGFYDRTTRTLYPIFVYDHPDKADVTPQEVDTAMRALQTALEAARRRASAPSPPSSQSGDVS